MSTALSRINYISDWLVDERLRPEFERWARDSVRPLMDRLGWMARNGETEDVQSLRSAVIFTMGNAGRDAGVLREARRLASLHVTDAARLPASIAGVTLQVAALEGNPELYDRYFAQMTRSTTPGEQLEYLTGLSFFSDAELQQRTLAYAMSSTIRSQDAPRLIRLMMRRPSANAATWQHIKNHWETIERSFGIFQGIPTVVGSISHMCDAAARADAEQFFSQHRAAGTARTLQQSLEAIDRCVATKSAQAANLAAFLAATAR